MRTAAIICIFVLSVCSITAQEKDYTKYHAAVASAEDTLGGEHFKEALQIYQATFKKYDFIFAKDVYLACQIAGYLNQKNDFDSLYILCAKQGVSFDLLKKTKLINQHLRKDSLNYFNLHKKYRNTYLSHIDLKLRKEMAGRFKEEQEMKGASIPMYRQVVDGNYIRIEELAKLGQFPGERIIGLDYGISGGHSMDIGISNDFTYASLLHHPYSYSGLKHDLWEAVKMGITTPDYVVYLYSFEQTRTSILYPKIEKYDSVKYAKCYNYPFGKQSKDLNAVNLNRKEVGLCRAETVQKKDNLMFKYGFVFRGM